MCVSQPHHMNHHRQICLGVHSRSNGLAKVRQPYPAKAMRAANDFVVVWKRLAVRRNCLTLLNYSLDAVGGLAGPEVVLRRVLAGLLASVRQLSIS
jgi:hypothetical protein